MKKAAGFWINGLELLAASSLLRAIQRGLLFPLPLIFVGAIALCLLNFPSMAVQEFFKGVLGEGWRHVLELLVRGSFGIGTLVVVGATAYSFGQFVKTNDDGVILSPLMNAAVAISCYMMLIGDSEHWTRMLSLDHGVPLGVAVSVLASVVFMKLVAIRFFRPSFSSIGYDSATFQVMALMPAAVTTIVLFAVAKVVFDLLIPLDFSVATFLANNVFEGETGGLGLGMVYTSVSQMLWFFGFHGPNVLFGFEQKTLNIAMLDNIHAAIAYVPPPHIVTKGFLDSFASMGGSGATLSLILAVLFKSRVPANRQLCLLAFLPALFNVNEPLLFGIPLVLNPLYFIPFLLAPLLNILTAYAATFLELVPRTIESVHWTTPIFISGYVTTGSVTGIFLQVFNLALGVLVYLPFVMLADRLHDGRMQRTMKRLVAYAESATSAPHGERCLSLRGVEGYLARSLVQDLTRALKRKENFHLAYQPQINTGARKVDCVECLIRWEHPVYGLIPTSLTIVLAEEGGVIEELGEFVLESACSSCAGLSLGRGSDFRVAVNISASQLSNPSMADDIARILKNADIDARQLEVEITESVATIPDETTLDTLHSLRIMGVRIGIDDFGMGHTSLRYINEFPISTLKLDRSLTVENGDGVNDRIVRSIVNLGEELELRTVIEGVETVEQYNRFRDLGCSVFQGYYFSPPLSYEECLEFMDIYEKDARRV